MPNNIQVKSTGGIKLEGIGMAQLRVKELKKTSLEKFKKGLHDAGIWLKRESQKLVPVDTGALRASAKLRVEGPPGHPDVTISYEMPYAVHVHEDLEAFHNNGQAKYLEEPAREHHRTLLYIVESAFTDATDWKE